MQDYDFLGKSSTGLGLNWWAVDGRASVCHTNAPTNFLFIKFIVKNNIVDVNLS